MSKVNALGKYASAMRARADLIEANKAVFADYERIGMTIIDAESELRDAVAEDKDGIVGDGYQVVYSPQSQTYADIEKIDEMIENGVKLTPGLRAEIVKTVDRPAKITIRKIA